MTDIDFERPFDLHDVLDFLDAATEITRRQLAAAEDAKRPRAQSRRSTAWLTVVPPA